MTKKGLISRLRKIAERKKREPEVDHSVADDLLLEYIGDQEVTKQFRAIKKWYA